MVTYPALFNLETRKRCKVDDRFIDGSFACHWNCCPSECGLSNDLVNLFHDLSTVNLVNGCDQWKSRLDSDGYYTVGALGRLIDQQSIPSQSQPPRHGLRRHQSSSRGIEVYTTYCGACINGVECVDHILVTCLFTSAVRIKYSIGDLISFVANWSQCPSKKNRFMTICYGLIWSLWKCRNDRIFKMVFISPFGGAEQIKSLVYFWIKYRGEGVSCKWNEWSSSPFHDT
uniref:Reverse transcriptase zinc-binding domain-containing protein n=1 Tax=Lactuca sativa TaxID=4236 RepID=A0A9R1VWM2_LACSA|nr:hypothetical protein LSAT_V11C400206640 [Lactuca sativa]